MSDATRRLEVVVLMARGLPHWVYAAGMRHKVEIKIRSTTDPEGLAFGSKVSPWTPHDSDGQSACGQGLLLRFGSHSQSSLGLCTHFVLEGRCAPAEAFDCRFKDSAQLCVKLLVSGNSGTALRRFTDRAANLIQNALAPISAELDETFSRSLGEIHLPLANVLSGRVGCASDRALGGWLPLLPEPSNSGTEQPRLEDVELTPGIWMQVYVVPDHNAVLPSLRSQLEAQAGIRKTNAEQESQSSRAPISSVSPEPASDVSQTAERGLNTAVKAPVIWGPAAATKPMEDLIILDMSSETQPVLSQDANQNSKLQDDLLDVGSAAHQDTSVASYMNPVTSNSSAFSFIGASDSGSEKKSADDVNSHSSAFSFIGNSAPAQIEKSGSAFSFINSHAETQVQSQTPGAQIDLGALYASAPLWKPPVVSTSPTYDVKYQALASLDQLALQTPKQVDFSDLDALGKQSMHK
eukprot:gnl/MRDRNA2_/MRDRNA2_130769_c0_seq1.p1 gnl/MRDRNA2_/MRDRNA2_130769_c0~~gnl/MRDRNA2_/MRDRNA2_130769_c0_seq1.p1  ORF type:complete len:465 (-),score=84.53 gnl/MRDRNA2_/MRDRNA2_130769_c0_seq1:53-1447(-)